MPRHVTVTTGARLHFGPLAVGAAAGDRTFGGVGVMVDRPGFRIDIAHQACDEIDAGDRIRRVQNCLDACRRFLSALPRCRIRILEAPPAHAGFGAGTQLALALAAGLFHLSGEPVPPAPRLAEILGRGRRSAIGIHGFARGGFIVDAGKDSASGLGALAERVPLPESWRFLLMTPGHASGKSGESERAAFARLPPMPAAITRRLRELVARMIPAARAGDCAQFGAAVSEYGRLVGEFFAPEQGGPYAHPRAREIIERLRAAGVCGIAQTSWGPTLCALVDSEDRAASIADSLAERAETGNQTIRIAAPLNHGARIDCDETSTRT